MEVKLRHEQHQLRAYLACLLLLVSFSNIVFAANAAKNAAKNAETSIRQDLNEVSAKVTQYLETQSVGYPGQVSINVGSIDPNLRLNNCSDLQVFMPSGSRAWGNTSVAVRCITPYQWTIYVQATVNVAAKYLVAAAPLAQGQVITSKDFIVESGDLTQLPAGVFTEPSQVVGRLMTVSIVAGSVLRQELLKAPPSVQQGQTVMLTKSGSGFKVSAEGQSLSNASVGQLVKVKIMSGQVITGIARKDGSIEVGF